MPGGRTLPWPRALTEEVGPDSAVSAGAQEPPLGPKPDLERKSSLFCASSTGVRTRTRSVTEPVLFLGRVIVERCLNWPLRGGGERGPENHRSRVNVQRPRPTPEAAGRSAGLGEGAAHTSCGGCSSFPTAPGHSYRRRWGRARGTTWSARVTQTDGKRGEPPSGQAAEATPPRPVAVRVWSAWVSEGRAAAGQARPGAGAQAPGVCGRRA